MYRFISANKDSLTSFSFLIWSVVHCGLILPILFWDISPEFLRWFFSMFDANFILTNVLPYLFLISPSVFIASLTLIFPHGLSLSLSERVSHSLGWLQTQYVAEAELGLVILLFLQVWGTKYNVCHVGIEPRASGILDGHAICPGPSLSCFVLANC